MARKVAMAVVEIVAVGTPEQVAEAEGSHTGRYLADMLGAAKVAAE